MSDSDSFSDLVLELAEEFIDRCRRGERPLLSEYVHKYPQLAAEIREVFPAMAMVERIAIDDDSLERDPVTPAVPELSQIGDYRIIREVGRGGMGVVYEAEQVSLGRRVAVKVLPRTVFDNARVRQRFARESRAAAQLHHTNIVPVFGVGEQDGLQYYVMQFIQGLGLDQVLVELRRLQQTGSSMPGKPLPQRLSARHQTPGQLTPAHADVSADAVARSLMYGRLGETLLCPADNNHHSRGTVQTDVKEKRSAGVSIDADFSSGDQGLDHRPGLSDTVAGALSETARSGEIPFPGQSQVSSGKASRMPYWRSVATIGAEVANALQHAHQQGIVHRDIKPANLLMDMRGNVWVTDFGLAKASDQQDLTHTGDILGTLRYMAPEQFEGTVDHRTDTYSLGLTLYELLALRPAFMEKDRHKLMKQVTTGTPTPLKTLDPGLPTDLTTIVQKAIDRDPAHRYQSAQEMADDLERFLRDEPILARRISPVTRFVRWCKRNPLVSALTTTIAVLLIVVAIGSTLAAFRFEGLANRNALLVTQKDSALQEATKARKQADEDRRLAKLAQGEAEQAQVKAEAARDTEQQLRKEAELQRDRANISFNRARRAVDQYLAKITENELLSVPGLQPLRQDLLVEALKFYAEFVQEQADDPDVQIELAMAQYRLGVIQRELGDAEASKAANRKAVQQLESLRDRQLGGVEVLSKLAEAYYLDSRYDDAVALCEQILQSTPEHVKVRSSLAQTFNAQAIADKNKKDPAAALALHQKAFEIRRKLVEESPGSATSNAELAGTINNIGVLLNQQQKPQDALAMFELAVTYNEKACRLAPHSILWGRWNAISERNVGSSYSDLGQNSESLQHFQKMVEVRRRLVFQNPAVSSLRSELYQDMLTLADKQKQVGLTVEANRSYRDARDVLTQIPRETAAELFQLAVVYASLAASPDPAAIAMEENAEMADERQRNTDLAMQTLQQAVDKGWADPAALRNYKAFDPLRERQDFQTLAMTVETVAEANRLLAAKTATEQEKLANQQKAAAILGQLATDNPQHRQHQRALATTLHAMGVVQTGLKQFEAADQSLKRAIELRQQIHELKPEDPELQLDLLTSRVGLGQLLWQQQQFPAAYQLWLECLSVSRKLSESVADEGAIHLQNTRIERVIVDRYGQLGLVPLVVPFLEASTNSKRALAVDTDGFVTDGEFSTAAFFAKDPNLAREYLTQLAQALEASRDPNLTSELIHFVRGACLLGQDFPITPVIAEKVRQFHTESPNQWWIAVAAAHLDCRDGRYSDADSRLSTFAGSKVLQVDYLRAMIAWKLGDHARASEIWNNAEVRYAQHCANLLEQSPLATAKGLFGEHWWQFHYGQLMRQLAAETMADGNSVPEDPWQHLIQARGYSLIGETQLAETEIAAATAAAPNDPDVWLALAKLKDDSEELTTRVEAAFTRAVESTPNEPLPLIKRGRWYFEQGERDKAEADFAKAAEMTPHELNKFLEAGWWVVGPYPAELKEFCPPELDPDPSVPLHVIDTNTGLSNDPVKWRSINIEPPFSLNSPARMSGYSSNAAVYLLSYIYSPDERTTRIVFHGDSLPVRVWLNGQSLAGPVEEGIGWLFDRQFPIALRPGMNQILVKCSTDRLIQIALGDQPLQQAFELFKFGDFNQAAAYFSKELRRDPASWIVANAAYAAATGHDTDTYEMILTHSKAVHSSGSPSVDFKFVLDAACIAPQQVYAREELQDLEKKCPDVWNPGVHHWHYVIAAAACFRLGKWQAAIDYAEKSGEARNWPIKAMCYHKLGDEINAKLWLAKASKIVDEILTNYSASGAQGLWIYVPSLREAMQLIDGDSIELDARLDEFFSERRRLWEARDPLIAAFQQTIVDAPNNPQSYIARAKRFAELGRIPEAEADFDKAVELAPNDVETRLARCLYRADSGQTELAADDARTILSIGFGSDYDSAGYHAEGLLAEREPVLLELLRRHPQNSALHRIRGDFLAYRGRWAEAREAYTTGDPWWSQEACAAALSTLLNETEEFDRCLERVEGLWDPGNADAQLRVHLRGLMQSIRPMPPPQAEKLVSDLKALLVEKDLRLFRGTLGIAELRSGKFREAVNSLIAAHGPERYWQSLPHLSAPLAMAHWHLGEQDEARRILSRSANYIDLFFRHLHQSRSSGGTGTYDYLWLLTIVLHREARMLIDGPEAAEAEFADLFSPEKQTDIPRLSQLDNLETYWNKAVEAAGDDPVPFIKRGRWHLERGEKDKAAADLAKAAEMTPNTLNPFLEAGWWVVGPYSAELRQFSPPEAGADPSVPVHFMDSTSGMSLKPVAWRSIVPRPGGLVEVGNLPGRTESSSICALTVVYSPDERTALLEYRGGAMRMRVNGQSVSVDVTDKMPGNPWYEGQRIPIALRAGLNQILLKTTGPSFELKFRDEATDRALHLAEQCRFHASADVLQNHADQNIAGCREDLLTRTVLTLAPLSLLEDASAYDRVCGEAFARFDSTTDSGLIGWMAWLVTLRANPAFDSHREQCIAAAEAWVRQGLPFEHPFLISALANYRAGRFAEASVWASRATGLPARLPVQALLAWETDKKEQARQLLNEAREALRLEYARLLETPDQSGAARVPGMLPWWYDTLWLQVLLFEAEKVIAADETSIRQEILSLEEKLAEQWSESSETRAFDVAILSARMQQQTLAEQLRLRGRHQLQLGRLDAAAADLDQAIAIRPNDRELLIERARIHAQRGNAEQAAADIDAAFKASNAAGLPTYPWCDSVDLEFLQLPDVAEPIAEHRKTRQAMFVVKALLHARNGEADPANESIARLRALGRFAEAGGTALFLNDHARFAELCQEAIGTQFEENARLWLLVLSPSCPLNGAELVAFAEKVQLAAGDHALARQLLGLAYYRAGRFPEAVAQFDIANRLAGSWQTGALSWPGLAMAKQQLGRSDEARQWLDLTKHWLSLHLQGDQLNPEALGEHNLRVVEFATVELLYREARALIEAPPE